MPQRFTETMRAASEAGWSHAVQHRFVNELFAGAVPDAVMARYLIQDHRFLDSFLVLLGAALAPAVNSKGRRSGSTGLKVQRFQSRTSVLPATMSGKVVGSST